jgi:Putative esterase
MARSLAARSKPRVRWSLGLVLLSCLLAVTQLAFVSTASAATTASDDFNRADGGLGPNWTDISDGGLAISSQLVMGTAGQVTGDMWSAQAFGSDQYSQDEVTSTQLTGGQWIGPGVRLQNGGQDGYVGFYYWNFGSPELMLFKRSGGGWAEIGGGAYPVSPLAAGTTIGLTAAGSKISLLLNGTTVISVTDTSFTGGSPGIVAYGNPTADNWSGGNASGATFTVGGTVSGLSGTVVLQDNGGDDLSVGANGSFTFATALAAGAAYNVTVKTNPAGQACTVASGSGTIGSADVTGVGITCGTGPTGTTASDDFNRADGALGSSWTDISDGGLAISSQVVTGTVGAVRGDMWSAQAFGSDQYSQIEVTSTQLTGGQWIGPGVRLQNGGQNGYVGLYNWNNGSPQLSVFKRSGGGWAQISSAYPVSPLAAGTTLQLSAVGSVISFLENGIVVIQITDTSFTGGAPGIVSFGNPTADNWSGGNAPSPPKFQATYVSTDSNGIDTYQVLSTDNGYGPQQLRVLEPTDPAPGVAHNFLFVLPVETGLGTQFGDGMQTMLGLNAQNQYNLTIIEPTFGSSPWYADNPTDAKIQYETYLTQDLVPWVKSHLATSGSEQNWLIGFSKSGYGAQDLILKHPDVFTLAASWDFPASMTSYSAFGADSQSGYGTDANFQANYRLTTAFVDARKAPFLSENRIWIGGYGDYQPDDAAYDALLTSEGIAHSTETPTAMAHRWDSGWVPLALAALYQDSTSLSS